MKPRVSKRREARDDPRIRITYEVITEESARHGDVADAGWEDEEGVSMEPEEDDEEAADLAVKFLQENGALHPSSSHFHPGVWYSTEGHQDFRTGETTIHSYHLVDFETEEQEEIFARVTEGE